MAMLKILKTENYTYNGFNVKRIDSIEESSEEGSTSQTVFSLRKWFINGIEASIMKLYGEQLLWFYKDDPARINEVGTILYDFNPGCSLDEVEVIDLTADMETTDIISILKSRKDEIVNATLNLLPQALSGDSTNRSFYFHVDECGNLKVDYLYYSGSVVDKTCFYTILSHQIPNPEEYGYESISEMDFVACGYREHIQNKITEHIDMLEDNL